MQVAELANAKRFIVGLAPAAALWLMLTPPGALAASVDLIDGSRSKAIAWLLSQQAGDGRWRGVASGLRGPDGPRDDALDRS